MGYSKTFLLLGLLFAVLLNFCSARDLAEQTQSVKEPNYHGGGGYGHGGGGYGHGGGGYGHGGGGYGHGGGGYGHGGHHGGGHHGGHGGAAETEADGN